MKACVPSVILIWLLCVGSLTPVAKGDAFMVSKAMSALTIVEIFVEPDGIRVEMEIGGPDLEAFKNILPDSIHARAGGEYRPLKERIRTFFERDWVIRPDNSEPLVGRIVQMFPRKRIRRDEITGEPLVIQPEDVEDTLFVELRYSWSERPKLLVIRPPMSEDGRAQMANIGFVLYHRGVPVNDFRYLAAESTVDLDWNDPWFSRFHHRNLRRQYDSPLSVFLYAEFFEVRKEIIIRPKDLQHWVDLGLEGKETIAVEDQEELKQRVAEILAERGEVTVDGKKVKGTLDRIHFVRRTLRTTGVIDPPEELDINTATLGVIFVYPIDGLPIEASVTWDLFSPKISQIRAAATDEAGGLPFVLTPEEPILVWKNFLKNPTLPTMKVLAPPQPPKIFIPLVSLVCVGLALVLLVFAIRARKKENGNSGVLVMAGVISIVLAFLCMSYASVSLANPLASDSVLAPMQPQEVLQGLLHNVYRSCDHRDESLVYDQLAQSVSGDLLSDIYLQLRRSMELENQGGAKVKVDDVKVIDIEPQEPLDRPGFAYRCRWRAAGSVGHWGHIHRRVNQYDAIITIEPVDAAWKITDFEVRQQQRLDPAAVQQQKALQ